MQLKYYQYLRIYHLLKLLRFQKHSLRFGQIFFDIGRLKKDETTLIHGGASGIGTTALAICHALGIKTFATVGSEDKVEALSDLTTAINYKTQDFEQEILNHTQEQGVDVILDIVGGSYFQKKLKSIKNVMADLSLLALWEVELQKEFDLQKLIFKTCHNYRLNDASA
ncbi:zinc-binding dehydrogenase [Acinetobacter baumannii]